MYQIGNIYFITAIAVIGGGLFGFDISSMSAIIGTPQYRCYFNQGPEGPPYNNDSNCSGPKSSVQGGITAAMPGGSFCGAITSGFLSDILGRKRAIQIGAVIWCLGSIIVCASQNIGMLIAGRFINGFSVGICSAQVPVYVAELGGPILSLSEAQCADINSSTKQARSRSGSTTMGHHLGYIDQ